MRNGRSSIAFYLPALLLAGLFLLPSLHWKPGFSSIPSIVILVFLGVIILGVADISRKVVKMYKDLWSGVHTYRAATESDFAPLDVNFYENSTNALRAENFHFVDNVVNVTISNSWPKNHTVICHLLGDGGITMCAIYHLRLYGFVGLMQKIGTITRNLKMVECETELSDGSWVTTANNSEAERTGGYPFQDRSQFPLATSPQQIVREHRSHVQSVLRQKGGGVMPVRISNAAQLRESQDRQYLKKCAFRKGPNFSIAAEWESVAGRPLKPGEISTAANVAQALADNQSPDEVLPDFKNGGT